MAQGQWRWPAYLPASDKEIPWESLFFEKGHTYHGVEPEDGYIKIYNPMDVHGGLILVIIIGLQSIKSLDITCSTTYVSTR